VHAAEEKAGRSKQPPQDTCEIDAGSSATGEKGPALWSRIPFAKRCERDEEWEVHHREGWGEWRPSDLVDQGLPELNDARARRIDGVLGVRRVDEADHLEAKPGERERHGIRLIANGWLYATLTERVVAKEDLRLAVPLE